VQQVQVQVYKIANFNLPHLHFMPRLGMIAFEFHLALWHHKTRIPRMLWPYLCDPTFSHFGRTLTCDRRMDGHRAIAYSASRPCLKHASTPEQKPGQPWRSC